MLPSPYFAAFVLLFGEVELGQEGGDARVAPKNARVLFRKHVSVKGAARVPPVPGREAGKEKEQ